jgi:hypothetical protein
MLLLSENGIIGLEAILFKKRGITTSLDVEERVLQTQKRVRLSRHCDR